MGSQSKKAEIVRAARPHAVNRATADLRCGDFVVLQAGNGSSFLAQAAEAVDDDNLARARSIAGGESVLVLTRRRAVNLGLAADLSDGTPVLAMTLPDKTEACIINELADPTVAACGKIPVLKIDALQEYDVAAAAIELTKIARLLPSMVLHRIDSEEAVVLARDAGLVELNVETIFEHRTVLAHSLRRVVAARVPLADAENTSIIAFRPDDGGTDHLAIMIGDPKPGSTVLVRLHSECFTGDLLGSLRCDCGEQLRGAIKSIADAGGGILVYLAQEGRGIGLINKLRAYRLQDDGFDTVDANEQLGFDADERVYQPAAEILHQLGFQRARLLTNNPLKVEALARHGIEIVERVPHVFAANEHNRHYLATKAAKSGHLF